MTYTVGQIKRPYYTTESSYGVTDTTLRYLGELIRFKPSTNFSQELHYLQGSRAFGERTIGVKNVGFNLEAYVRRSTFTGQIYNWPQFWSTYTLGSETGMADPLPSFSLLIGKAVGSNNYYDLYNGCMIDKLEISCDEVGRIFRFNTDCIAQFVEKSNSKTFTGFQDITLGDDPSTPPTEPATWFGFFNGDSPMQIDFGDGNGYVDACPKKFSITLANNLEREYGLRWEAQPTQISHALAVNLVPGEAHYSCELTFAHKDEAWSNWKLATQDDMKLRIAIDSKYLILESGYIEASEFPELKQDRLEETVKIYFRTVSIQNAY